MSGAWRLYADVGNSALKWAARGDDAWLAADRLPIERLDAAALDVDIREAGLDPRECESAALVSSRPALADAAAEAIERATGAQVRLLGRELHAEIEVAYRDPAEIGQDRLAAAEGARALCGTPVIIITLGTCLTAQALNDAGVFVGGAIAAGPDAISVGIGELVPHLREPVAEAKSLITGGEAQVGVGRSTVENLAAGLLAALGGTADALVTMLRAEVGDAPVIATGGGLAIARAAGVRFDRAEPLLVLEGLRLIDERHRDGG